MQSDCILLGDCRDLILDVPNESVALVVTSPPYNAGKEYETKATLERYRGFAKLWTRRIPKVLTQRGSFWLNVGYTKLGPNRTLPLTYLYYDAVRLPMVQEIVWHFRGGMSYKARFSHRTERWMWFAKDTDNVLFNLDDVRDIRLNEADDYRNNPLGKNPTDYWQFMRVTNNAAEKTLHPCQFPEKMIERIILACSNPGDVVLDPFAGSGTTCAVAKRLGRRWLGFEQREDYHAVAVQRVAEVTV